MSDSTVDRTQAAQEARRAEERESKKNTDEQNQRFKDMLRKQDEQGNKAKKEKAAHDSKASQQAGGRRNAFLARQGIAANKFSALLQKDGLQRGEADQTLRNETEKLHNQAEERVEERVEEQRIEREEAQQERLDAVGRDDREGRGEGDGSGLGGGGGQQQNPDEQPHQGAATLDPLGGGQAAGARAATGAAGATPLPEQIVQQIVETVVQGVDPSGMGFVEMRLKEGVLSGARLRMGMGKDGKLILEVFTDDPDTRRLLTSLSSRQDLERRLEARGIPLGSLAVHNQ